LDFDMPEVNQERYRDCEQHLNRLDRLEAIILNNQDRISHIEESNRIMAKVIANEAAKEAVKQVFLMISVNVDSAESMKEFRENLSFASIAHSTAKATAIAFITTVTGLVSAAIWFSLKEMFSK